ncbi:MAG: zf-HC2 domain-containing protein [Chloroflexi bacterium]|nr:zf-HC2 domain-containing protein [Chloroflexota bacterium]
MNCDRRLLSDYKDGELSTQKRSEVEEHLKGCAECREVLGAYQSISRAIRALPRYEVPEAVVKGVRDRVETEHLGIGSAPYQATLLRFGALAAVALVVVLAASATFRHAPANEPGSQAGAPTAETASVEPAGPTLIAQAIPPTPLDVEQKPAAPPVPYQPTTVPLKPGGGSEGADGPTSRKPAAQPPAAAPKSAAPAAAPTAIAPPPSVPQVAKVEEPRPTAISTRESTRPSAAVPADPTLEAGPDQPATAATPTPTVVPGPFSIAASMDITPGVVPSPTMSIAPRLSLSATMQILIGDGVSTTVGCPAIVRPEFGLVYGNAEVRRKLGCAGGVDKALQVVEESFEGGEVFWRGDTRQIYALSSEGSWKVYKDTWAETDPDPSPAPPKGKHAPIGAIGNLWREDTTARATLGWAVEPERAYESAIQEFEQGSMLWSDRKMVYVLYADGTWQRYPDSSVQLPQGTTSPASHAIGERIGL